MQNRTPPVSSTVRSEILLASSLPPTTANAVQTRMRVTLDTLREDEVSTKLKFFRFNYGALDIPPMSQSEFSGHCDLRAVHENAVKDPFSLKLHYVMPHYHTLGSSFRLQHLGGPKDGEDIYAIDNRYGEPLGHAFEQPVDLSEGNGLSFTCGYDNPRAESVGFGIGDQEMCVMLGFAESKMIFDGAVNNNSDVQTGQDGVIRNTGPCDVIGSERGD